jgi:hypothetical protein
LFNQLLLVSPTVTTFTDEAYVAVNSQNDDGSSNANVTLNVTGFQGVLAADKTGVNVLANGDGNTYDVGERALVLASNLTINSTSGIQIFPTLETEPGAYAYEMFLHCLQGATAAAPGVDIGFAGTFAGGAGILESSTYGGTPTGETVHFYPLTAATFSNSLPAYAANGNFFVKATGTMSFSSAGAIAPFGFIAAAGDTWQVAEGSFFKLRPCRHPT